jgi:hypothetical protein
MSDPTPTFPVLASDPSAGSLDGSSGRGTRWWLYVLFWLLTMFSTTVVGAGIEFNYLHHQPMFSLNDDAISPSSRSVGRWRPSEPAAGPAFSLTLMFILFAHEMGHYLYARHYRVYATPPFSCPFPA